MIFGELIAGILCAAATESVPKPKKQAGSSIPWNAFRRNIMPTPST